MKKKNRENTKTPHQDIGVDTARHCGACARVHRGVGEPVFARVLKDICVAQARVAAILGETAAVKIVQPNTGAQGWDSNHRDKPL